MTLKFETTTGIKLAEGIRNATPKEIDNSIRIESITLDGKPHVQTIGSPSFILQFEILCNGDQMTLINNAYANALRIKYVFQNIEYIGILKNNPKFDRFGKLKETTADTKFTTSIILSILEENAL